MHKLVSVKLKIKSPGKGLTYTHYWMFIAITDGWGSLHRGEYRGGWGSLLIQHFLTVINNHATITLLCKVQLLHLYCTLYLDYTQLVSVSSSCVVWQKRGSVRSGEN